MKDFSDKVVIITGASSGIGKALAYEFSKLGAKVNLAARRVERLEAIKSELDTLDHNIIVTQTDISQKKDCENLINKTVEKFGRIDILINNAGISMRAVFAEVEFDVLEKLMNVNFWGTVYCTKFALPYLLKARGVVIGISSIAGFHGLPGRSGYSASKFAIHGFLETLRIENLKNGLHVLVVAPGFTASDIRLHALNSVGNEQEETPRNEEKMMSPEHVAKIIIRSIKRKKRNKILSLNGQLVALLQRIIPHQVDWMIYKSMAKEPNSPFH